MSERYIQVKPSREKLNPDDIVSHISSLHKLTSHGKDNVSIATKLHPLKESGGEVPKFEFIAVSQGKDAPVEFYYGASERYIDNLKKRLTTAYPSSFDVDFVEIDLTKKIIPPKRYTPEDFVKQVRDGKLLFDPDATGTYGDISGERKNKEEQEADDESNGSSLNQREQSKKDQITQGEYIPVDRESETTKSVIKEDAVTTSGETKTIDPEDIDGYDMLEELDAGLLDLVDLPEEIDATHLEAKVDSPTWTEDGEILARPTLEHGEPVAVRWNGVGERKQDWMTTLKMFSKVSEPDADDIDDRAPLATLVQHLAETDYPIAYQTVFKRVQDWTRTAERRKDNLHLDRDTLGQKITYELGQILFKPSKERRRERMRDYMDRIGETAGSNAESPVSGEVGQRRQLIDNKIPKRTFRANIRAVSVATEAANIPSVEKTMDDIASVLDHLDGYFYEVNADILRDTDGIRGGKNATEEFHRLVNGEIVTGSGKKRPDIIANADELSNFIAVPSSSNLTVEGVRGSRAKAESRDPLPKPDPSLMKEFHKPGMRIGYALDKEADPEPVPTQVPPHLLTKHYGRFATTGAGKSIALVNDLLSLHENTSGPAILIDPKGDGMTQNYMKAHFERFGEEDLKNNVIHYPIPDILPGFTFFNIEPSLKQGKRRSDAIQNKADHYQELLKLVMGRERYEQSKVAPTIISALIKALFDEQYYDEKMKDKENGDLDPDDILAERDSANKFSHRQLERLTKQYRKYGTSDGSAEDRDGEIPDVSVDPIRDTLEEQAEGADTRTFSTIMNAVFNRLNYIREDTHLRRIFNNTDQRFDFRDHLSEDKVILFDLGELRDDATMVMTGLILTNLWDALREGDQTECTMGHESRDECRAHARQNGLDPKDPPCRESWADDHTVNLIIDESASVAVSDIMDKMLEQGRSFKLSVGLSMQFPEQMKSGGNERTYRNVLNNVATLLIGRITLDEEIAEAMAHEGMDVLEFSNRIKALPRGEWIAQLPSPTFMETGPEPISLKPLPVPAGHPESNRVLNEEAEQRFSHIVETQVHGRTQQEYGIPEEDMEENGEELIELPDSTSVRSGDGENKESNNDGDDGEDGDDSSDDISLSAGPDPEQDETEKSESSGSSSDEDDESEGQQDTEETTNNGNVSSAGFGEREETPESLPPYVESLDGGDAYQCLVCGEEYLPLQREEAIACCLPTLQWYKGKYRPKETEKLDTKSSYVTYTQKVESEPYGTSMISLVSSKQDTEESNNGHEEGTPGVDLSETISTVDDMVSVLVETGEDNMIQPESYGSVASAIVAETPPEYQNRVESVIVKYGNELSDQDNVKRESTLGIGTFTPLVYETPPAEIDVDIKSVLNELYSSNVQDAPFAVWEANGLPKPMKRFSSGRVKVHGTIYRTGYVGTAYTDNVQQHIDVDYRHRDIAPYRIPDDFSEYIEDTSITGDAPLASSHLDEYGITAREAGFMRDVVKASNRTLAGYDLLRSMKTEILDKYGDVDIEKLKDQGYLYEVEFRKKKYYQLNPAGMSACEFKYNSGRGVGDPGDEILHRVGGRIAEEYYRQQEEVSFVRLFDQSRRVDNSVLDVEAVSDEGTTVYAAEIESNTSKNYSAVADDAEAMSKVAGKSIWVLRDKELALEVLRILRSEDVIDVSDEQLDQFENNNMTYSEFSENVLADQHDGIDEIVSFRQMYDAIDMEKATKV